jgi:hypothetical protein
MNITWSSQAEDKMGHVSPKSYMERTSNCSFFGSAHQKRRTCLRGGADYPKEEERTVLSRRDKTKVPLLMCLAFVRLYRLTD